MAGRDRDDVKLFRSFVSVSPYYCIAAKYLCSKLSSVLELKQLCLLFKHLVPASAQNIFRYHDKTAPGKIHFNNCLICMLGDHDALMTGYLSPRSI